MAFEAADFKTRFISLYRGITVCLVGSQRMVRLQAPPRVGITRELGHASLIFNVLMCTVAIWQLINFTLANAKLAILFVKGRPPVKKS